MHNLFLYFIFPQFSDPAPSLPIHDLTLLEVKLMDAKNSLWDRYQAMFALRNLNTDDAAKVLAKGCCRFSLFIVCFWLL